MTTHRVFLVVGALAIAAAQQAQAQKTVTFTPSVTAGDGQLVTDISWSTSPAIPTGTPCAAKSTPPTTGWSGAKPDHGTVTGLVVTQNTNIGIDCTFAGDSIVTFTWTPTATNTDSTPYTNPLNVRLKYTFNPTITTGPTTATGETAVDVPDTAAARPTMRTVTGISQTGTMRAAGYSQNTNNVYSAASNVATKVFQGSVVVSQGVDLTIRSVPGPITGLGAQ